MLNISNKNSIPVSNLEKHSAVQQLNNSKHYKILNKILVISVINMYNLSYEIKLFPFIS